ncbi:chondroadherin-like protein [Liolophura sinensis]|uniref:chondroadherin-like protein n=1 Tax=Liolophura sinensis TaxID=3198878 RepID=UPI0031590400
MVGVMIAVALTLTGSSLMVAGVTYNFADACVAGPPCECYKKTEYTKDEPDGFEVSVLDCSDKRISAVPFFRQLENVTVDRVFLQNNRIAVVPKDAFFGLSASLIDLSGNKIDTIEENAFRGLETRLTTLRLGSNRLSTWPISAVSSLESLQTLDLLSNEEIYQLPWNSFRGLTSLRKLDLGNCAEGFQIHDEAFEPIQETLKQLMLHHCALTEVPKALSVLGNVEILRLPRNRFSSLTSESFQGLHSLKTLDLTGNANLSSSESFPPDSFAEVGETLELLDLTGIGLTRIPTIFTPLEKLKSLYLSRNQISSIERGTFSVLTSLEKLYIDNNPLDYSQGMFDGLKESLTFIKVASQNISRLPNPELTSLRGLRTVDASHNAFGELPGDFAEGIPATDYHLSNSDITKISPTAFSGKSSQVSLTLQGNSLETLDFVQDPCYYWRIDVTDNPILCDCHTYRLSKYPHLLVKGTCAKPDFVEGLAIGSTEFDNTMYWRCVDHFFEDTKLCSKWWLSAGSWVRQSPATITLSLLTVLSFLR